MFTNDDAIIRQCEYKSNLLIGLSDSLSFWKLKTVFSTENTTR